MYVYKPQTPTSSALTNAAEGWFDEGARTVGVPPHRPVRHHTAHMGQHGRRRRRRRRRAMGKVVARVEA